jgi:L-rhamnose mutarotase
VLSALERHHVYDYSIHYLESMDLLVANFKYKGTDYEKDMAAIGKDQETQRWWKLTDRMQESLVPGATGSGKSVPWWLVSILLCPGRRKLADTLHPA